MVSQFAALSEIVPAPGLFSGVAVSLVRKCDTSPEIISPSDGHAVFKVHRTDMTIVEENKALSRISKRSE